MCPMVKISGQRFFPNKKTTRPWNRHQETKVEPLARPQDTHPVRSYQIKSESEKKNRKPGLVNIQKTMENHHFQWVNPLYINGHLKNSYFDMTRG